MSDATRSATVGPSKLVGVVDTSTYDARWTAVAERFATADKVTDRIQALAKVDRPESSAHGYLIGALLQIGEAHAGCTVGDCPTCTTLAGAVSMILAEHEIRQGRVPGAAYLPPYPGA
jgi:hypothetical protein